MRYMNELEKKVEPGPWCQIEKQQVEKNIQNSKEPDRFARLTNINKDI